MNKYKVVWHYESDLFILNGPKFKSVCVCPAESKDKAIKFVMGFDDARVIEGKQYSNIIIDSIEEVKNNERISNSKH